MQFIIVTGMSGAGKSTVLKFLEDLGFFCVDNLPPLLIPKFAEACFKAGSDIEKTALGLDIRGGKLFDDLFTGLESLGEEYNYSILFLDATNEILLNRYKETRRTHPLSKGDSIINGITKERELLLNIKDKSDYILDTTYSLPRQLKEQINDIFLGNKPFSNLTITILSFGFKYGIPNDTDLLFDVRFIPNPFYIAELKEQTGNDKPVQDYVMSHEVSTNFLKKLIDMIDYLIPHYIKEDKNQLIISIGCTGGKHRSVTLANELYTHMHNNNHSVIINHRDVNKDFRKV